MAYIEALKSGSYRATVRVNGKRIKAVFDSDWEAEGWAAETEARAADARALAATTVAAITGNAPVNPPPTPVVKVPTIFAHGTSWVQRRRARLAKATVSNYTTHLRMLNAEGLGARPLDQVMRAEVDQWQTDASEAGAGASALNARLKLLRSIYKDALAAGLVQHDPTYGVDALAVADLPDRHLTAAEEATVMMAAGDTTALPILLALEAGLRWSEVFGLSAAAVLDAQDFISVHQVNERDTRSIREYTKGHRRRDVPMTSKLAAALVPYAETVRDARGHDALLFTSKAGTPVDYWNWRDRDYLPVIAAAKIRPVGFHGLRHTYGTKLSRAGVPRPEIAVLMGHADEETTARYIHKDTDGRRLTLVRDALDPKPEQAASA